MTVDTVSILTKLIAEACLLAAALGCLYLLAAAIAVLLFRHRRQFRHWHPAPVTVLKPLRGAEPDLARRLLSFCEQDYRAPIQLVCGVQDAADGAIAAVKDVAARANNVELKIDGRRRGGNPKISNLINMFAAARHDVVVMADSDIEVGPDYLRELVTELRDPRVGAVSCLYHGVPTESIWARQSALAINSHFLPNAVFALRFGLAQPCFGATIAMRRSTLRHVGGLEAFEDALADDYEIGVAVRAGGYRVAIPEFAVGHACFEASLADLLAHDLRTARTVKSIDPLGHYGAFITHPFPLALLALLSGGGGKAALVAAIALAGRAVLCRCVEHSFALPRQPYWLIPLREILSFAVYIWSLFGTAVSWRGARYEVGVDGRLVAGKRAKP